MNFDPDDPRWTAYALGELSPEETEATEALLAESPEARQEVEEIRGFADLLQQTFARETASTPAPDWESVAGVVQSRTPEPATAPNENAPEVIDFPSEPAASPKSRWGWWTGLGLAAAAAVVAMMVWLPPWARRNEVKILASRSVSPTEPVRRGESDGDAGSQPFVATDLAVRAPEPEPLPGPPPSTSTRAPAPTPEAGPNAPTVENVEKNARPLVTSSPELMRRYGLLPTPQPEAPPSSSASVAGPATANRAASGTEPRSGARYGLGPSRPASDAAPAVPSAAPTTMPMSPELRRRYGLGPGGFVPEASRLESAARPVPPVGKGFETFDESSLGGADRFVAPVAQTATRGKMAYRMGQPAPGEPEPFDEAARPGHNPGYVDAGDNAFLSPWTQPLSTFGLDVDTGSYANVRRFLTAGSLPPRAAVRVEEMINYFAYRYPEPEGDDVFGVRADVGMCPWEPAHRLVRVAVKARNVRGERPVANLVFLVDVSGSMQPSERLPLLKQALRSLAKRLSPADRVAIVTYASSAGVRLPSTSAEQRDRILEAIDSLEAGGSTNGEGGIRQAYEAARSHFVPGGVNRVLLCTDGDFNVGMSDQNALVRLIEQEAKSGVFLTTLGVGTDNFKDALMQRLADRGNGSYHFLDSFEEAQRVLADQCDATLVTVARDAKAQVEFNPGNVAAWRLIGYEKRLMPAQDFNDDTKDAGEVGAGQTVTVLYEIVPVGARVPGAVDPLKYQPTEERGSRGVPRGPELLTVKLRYQRPEGSNSVAKEYPVPDRERELDGDFRFAAAVAAFGMALRDPSWDGGRGFDTALRLAQGSLGEDPGGWRAEFLMLVRKARALRR